MRYLVLLLVLFSLPALAQQTPITALPGASPLQPNDLFPLDQRIGNTTTPSHVTTANLFNQGPKATLGNGPGILYNSSSGLSYVNTANAQAALNEINTTGSVGTAAYTVAPCTGSGDQTALATAFGTKNSVSPVLYPDGCVLTGQLVLPFQGYSKLFQLGNYSTEFNTAQGGGTGTRGDPRILINLDDIASTSGQVGINVNGQSQFVIDSATIMATGSSTRYATTMIGPTSQGQGGCCNSRTIDIINSSIGGGPTLVGCPVDATGNCVQNGGVKTGTLTSGGSGYVNGTYTNVPLTGGTGTGAVAISIVVSGGIVTSVSLATTSALATPGAAYVIGDVLSASNTNLGGTGSGLQFTVSALYTNTTSGNNYFPYIVNSFLSGMSGVAVSGNWSDGRFVNSTFTDGPAITSSFGAGGEIWNNRFEDSSNAITLPTGTDMISNNDFTIFSFGGGYDMSLVSGDGYTVTGNDFNHAVSGGPNPDVDSILLGLSGNLSNVTIVGNTWHIQASQRKYCIDIKSGHTVDYLSMQGNVCNLAHGIGNVHYEQVPAHFVEDFVGPLGQHAEMGRPFGIGTSAPIGIGSAVLDLEGTTSVHIPNGSTAQRPADPTTAMLRYNSTINAFEGYSAGAWNYLFQIGQQVNANPGDGITVPFVATANANTNNPTSGLTDYYKFDDASGSTAADAVGSNPGTWQGTLGSQWGTGIINGDGVFDGSTNRLETTYTGVLGTNPFAVSLWFKTTASTPHGANGLSSLITWGSGAGHSVTLNTNDKYGGGTNFNGITLDNFAGAITYSTGAINIYDGNWHNIVLDVPANALLSTVQFYLDNTLLTTVSHSGTPNSPINITSGGTVTFGGIQGSNGADFTGQIDEAGLWNRTLTASEVAFLYNGGAANQYPFSAETATLDIADFKNSSGSIVSEFNASGKLGIGTSMPTSKLTVTGLGTTAPIGTTTGAGYACVDSNGAFYVKASSCP